MEHLELLMLSLDMVNKYSLATDLPISLNQNTQAICPANLKARQFRQNFQLIQMPQKKTDKKTMNDRSI
jgi:hypothetical protein